MTDIREMFLYVSVFCLRFRAKKVYVAKVYALFSSPRVGGPNPRWGLAKGFSLLEEMFRGGGTQHTIFFGEEIGGVRGTPAPNKERLGKL